MEIESVEKGWGENSTYYSTREKAGYTYRVHNIKEETKQVSPDYMFNVYRGYVDGKIVFEIGASIDVTVRYKRNTDETSK